MTSSEPSLSPSLSGRARPVVVITADNDVSGRHALRHATTLFGSAHSYLVIGVHRHGHRRERADAEEFARSVASSAPELAEILVVSGDRSGAVCDTAHRCGAAAIVVGVDLGSHDRTAASHAFRILRRSPCPIVMVAT